MVDRDTIIDSGDDGGGNILLAIVVLVVLAISAYVLFINRPGAPGNGMTVVAPSITTSAPAD